MTPGNTLVSLLQGGFGSLAAYLAAHVLLCLLPAFFVAGALSALVPKEAVTRFLGPRAPKIVSYPAAALGGFVLAVCSCTILPLFAGIHKKGAGLGPAITFLFVGPAINILALSYTGVALGADFAVARLVLSLAFGIGIGLIMAVIFADDASQRTAGDGSGDGGAYGSAVRVEGRVWLFLGLLLALLIVGTLQVPLLTDSYASVTLPISGAERLQATLNRLVPFDASRGEEGVSVQGAVLIGLLGLIALTAWRGLGRVDAGYNRWTGPALGITAVTLVVAAVGLVPQDGGLSVLLRGKAVATVVLIAALFAVGRRLFADYEMQEFLWETWRFVKAIFPLLVVGVFAVGLVRPFIRPEWILALAGKNTVLANLVGVVFGVFMYFPTLLEVPIANMFLGLGMHRGPLLAYLMADPELSLQSILITARVIGRVRAWVYVGWVALFSVLAGLAFGAWSDGANPWALLAYVAVGLAVLAVALRLVSARPRQRAATGEETAQAR